ncbi:hypothetical protein ACW9HQ_46870, partial [Nocardia gipuzkoensis]
IGDDRVTLRVEPDGEGGWRCVPDERVRQPDETPEAEEAAEKKSLLRKVLDWLRRPRTQDLPPAPSGSGSALPQPHSDSAGTPPATQPHPPHGGGFDVGDFITGMQGASEVIKKLPIGLTVELLTFYQNREQLGDFLLNRHYENELPSARRADGSEYEYWKEQADPNLLRQVGLTPDQADRFGRSHDQEQGPPEQKPGEKPAPP